MILLAAVVFLSGAAVLILELLGTRLVAPLFGTTLYVWAALITVTLTALAAGYAAGGVLADRPAPRGRPELVLRLAWLLAGAGLWLLPLIYARRPLLEAFSGLGLRWGALACAAAALGPPLACLGAVSPLAVRLRAGEPGRLGRAAGAVSALSTAGSVAGALAAGFYLIPSQATGALLAGLSAALLLLSGACLLKARGRHGRLNAACLAAYGAVVCAAQRAGAPRVPGLRLHAQSFYGDVAVMDRPDRGKRILYIDGVPNTVVDLKTMESTSDYIRSFELLPLLRPDGRRALLIGMGGGGLVRRFRDHYGIATDVVDVDPVVMAAARDFFAFVPSGSVVLEDGRRFLERGSQAYDFIVMDAFNGDQHPFHLFTREAFSAASARLKPDGVLAINAIGYALGPRAGLKRSLERTLRAVFPQVRVLAANADLDPASDCVNLTLLASAAPLALRRDPLLARPEFARYWRRVSRNFVDEPGAPAAVITDDFNPIEALSAPGFRELRERFMASRLDLL